jgi:hypothetical protein
MHLTPIQKERLLNRDDPEYANVKRTNDYLIRETLKEFLDTGDVNLILEKLPKEQIERVLTDDAVFGLLRLAETLISRLGPGEGDHYIVPKEAQLQNAKKQDVIKVSSQEKHRIDRIEMHINKLLSLKSDFLMRWGTYDNLQKMETAGMKIPYKKVEKTVEVPK